ncbi:MAG: hypothetical protein LPK26_05610 [Bacillaceae bacterium]|nr:hypothetical protein [Bacillaceae bacterium]
MDGVKIACQEILMRIQLMDGVKISYQTQEEIERIIRSTYHLGYADGQLEAEKKPIKIS